jgi:hypothetical protein
MLLLLLLVYPELHTRLASRQEGTKICHLIGSMIVHISGLCFDKPRQF